MPARFLTDRITHGDASGIMEENQCIMHCVQKNHRSHHTAFQYIFDGMAFLPERLPVTFFCCKRSVGMPIFNNLALFCTGAAVPFEARGYPRFFRRYLIGYKALSPLTA
jgi:hypothetical protein